MLNEQERGLILLTRSALTGRAERLPAAFDLEAAVTLTIQHQITPLIYYGAVNCGITSNADGMDKLLSLTAQLISISESQMLELSRLTRAFEEEGVDYLLLKGCVMKQLYPQPEMRVMSDVDILIRPSQYERIKPIMRQLGFTEGIESNHELPWSKRNIHVELHKRLIPSYNEDYYAYFGDGWMRAKPTGEGSHRYRFSDEDELIYLFCHFAKHYRDGGIGIKHLTDLWVYCEKKPQLDKAYLHAELDKLGLAAFFENVMMTCAVWFDAAASTEMTDFLSNVIINSGAYGKGETKRVSWAVRISGEDSSGKKAHLRWKLEVIFLPYWKMCLKYPILKKLPVLLPFFWVVRWGETLLLRPKNIRKQMDYAKEMKPEDIEQYRRSLDYVGLRYHNGVKCAQEPASKASGESQDFAKMS